MDEIKRSEKNLEITSINYLLDRDYGQHSILPVHKLLFNFSRGRYTREELYDRLNKADILNVDEYIKYYTKKTGELPQLNVAERIKQRIKIINDLVAELKILINQKENPGEIYQVMLRFKSQAGFEKIKKISYFENV